LETNVTVNRIAVKSKTSVCKTRLIGDNLLTSGKNDSTQVWLTSYPHTLPGVFLRVSFFALTGPNVELFNMRLKVFWHNTRF